MSLPPSGRLGSLGKTGSDILHRRGSRSRRCREHTPVITRAFHPRADRRGGPDGFPRWGLSTESLGPTIGSGVPKWDPGKGLAYASGGGGGGVRTQTSKIEATTSSGSTWDILGVVLGVWVVKGLTTATWPPRRETAGVYAVTLGDAPVLPNTPEDVERMFREFAYDLN
jgi:hypothetical protein